MKKIYLLLLVTLVFSACKEDNVPYPPTIGVANTTVSKEAQTVSLPIVSDMKVLNVTMDESGASWCSFEWNESEIIVDVQANKLIPRQVTFNIEGEVRSVTTVLSQEGRKLSDFEEHSKANWEIADVCDEIVGDGGGAIAILEDSHSTFWHNNWANADDVLPHWIVIDMKEELSVDMIQLGWRQYGDSYYYNNRVTNVYIGNSPDPAALTNKVGSLTTIPIGNSHVDSKHEPYHNVGLDKAKGRYLKLEVTESNSGQTSIIAFVKAFQYVGND